MYIQVFTKSMLNSQEYTFTLRFSRYGGPDSQAITQDYGINWGYYLASSRGVIYAKIDGRGSARQSAEQKFAVYRNLGSAEVEDQISVAR